MLDLYSSGKEGRAIGSIGLFRDAVDNTERTAWPFHLDISEVRKAGELTIQVWDRVAKILAQVRPLASEFYRLTNKPFGVTGEVGEQFAADLLGLNLADARTAGYDATRPNPEVGKAPERLQIKTRAYSNGSDAGQRMGRLTPSTPCDAVLLAPETLDVRVIWEAPFSSLAPRLSDPTSSLRRHGSFKVVVFMKLATQIWSKT